VKVVGRIAQLLATEINYTLAEITIPFLLCTPCSHNNIADEPSSVGLLCRHHSFCPVLCSILQTEWLSCCL